MLGLRKKDPERLDVYLHGLEGTTKFERSLMEKLERLSHCVFSLHETVKQVGAEQERVRAELAELKQEIQEAGQRFSTLFDEYKAARDAGNDAEAKDVADELDRLATALKAGTTKPE